MNTKNNKLTIFASFPSDILTDYQSSGDGLLAFQYISRLAQRGHTLHVFCEFADIQSKLPENVTLYPLSDRREENGKANRLRYFLRSRSLLLDLTQKCKIDLIHELNPGFAALSLAFLGTKIPVIIGPIPGKWPFDSDYLISNKLQFYKLKLISIIKFFSISCIKYFQQLHASILLFSTPGSAFSFGIFGDSKIKSRVLPIGIEFAKSLPLSSFEAKDNNSAKFTVLYLAKIEIRKGIFTLLDAFEILSQRLPDCKLIVAGSGSELNAVENRIAQMTCQNNITITGNVDHENVFEVMGRCAVYCLPSYGEPFGITLLEAMACGKPVVTTDLGGPRYIISDQGGCRVPPRNADALADALFEILSSQELQQKMGRFNRELVEKIYAWEGIIDKLEEIYHEAIYN